MDARVEVQAARVSVRVLQVGVVTSSSAIRPFRVLVAGAGERAAGIPRVRPPPPLRQATVGGSAAHAALPSDARPKMRAA